MPIPKKENETRTSATVYTEDLGIMREIARIKFDNDQLNNAWKEAVKLFIKKNIHLLEERYEKLKKEYE